MILEVLMTREDELEHAIELARHDLARLNDDLEIAEQALCNAEADVQAIEDEIEEVERELLELKNEAEDDVQIHRTTR